MITGNYSGAMLAAFALALLQRAGAQPGSLDTDFASNLSLGVENWACVNCMAITPDGKVYIGGAFTLVNGVARGCIARLNPDGTIDAGFNSSSGADDAVTAIALHSAGEQGATSPSHWRSRWTAMCWRPTCIFRPI